MMASKPKLAVHKFSSCDGCQLAFLNLGEDLLTLADRVELVHFAEAGPCNPDLPVDIAMVEGSVSTPDEAQRIRRIRAGSKLLISIGACATSGGLQALRNRAREGDWRADIYAHPEAIESLRQVSPLKDHVRVDFELWGCPITSAQLVATLNALLEGLPPTQSHAKLCLECKRHQQVCVWISRREPCLGPLTMAGCGALCPAFGRACYGCFGPSETPRADAVGGYLEGLGLSPEQARQRLHLIHSNAAEWRQDQPA
jgi:sulfhydrogenase subunit delta